nr:MULTISPECIES: helix-turn-helix transcriptional regulator [Halostella]
MAGMSGSADHILEFLNNGSEEPLVSTPKVIAANIDYKADTVRKRIRKLHDAGLVEYADEQASLYQITEKGDRRLQGELTNDEIDEIEDILSS